MADFCRRHRSLCIVLVAAFFVRILFFWIYPSIHFADAMAYRTIGNEIFSGQIITNHIYMPLYPILAYLSGGGIGQIIADIVLSTMSVALIYLLSIELFNNKIAAVVASIVAALYPHFLFYAVTGLTETFFTFLLLLAFLLLYKGKIVPAIIVLVLSILVRPSLDLLNPILVFIFVAFIYQSSSIRVMKGFKYVAIYALCYLLLIAPWWVHQHQKYGTFVRLHLADGIILYSGNNPINVTGGGVGRENSSVQDMDYFSFENIADPIARNEAMKQAAIDFIIENPRRFIELAGLKFVRFWRLWPHTDQYQQWYTIAASLLSYGVVLLFSIGFMIRKGRHYFWHLMPIFALFSYLTLIHMVTIGSIRYRFPLEPFLIIFAAYFLVDIGQGSRWKMWLEKWVGGKLR